MADWPDVGGRMADWPDDMDCLADGLFCWLVLVFVAIGCARACNDWFGVLWSFMNLPFLSFIIFLFSLFSSTL
jgi:hypothetical protein